MPYICPACGINSNQSLCQNCQKIVLMGKSIYDINKISEVIQYQNKEHQRLADIEEQERIDECKDEELIKKGLTIVSARIERERERERDGQVAALQPAVHTNKLQRVFGWLF